MKNSKWLVFYAAIVAFFAIYAFIWTIIEPIPICSEFEWMRLVLIVAISLGLSIVTIIKKGLANHLYFRYIYPQFINIHQRLSNRPQDDSLIDNWKLNGVDCRPELRDDNLFGKVCYFDGSKHKDTYRKFDVSAREDSTSIEYFIKAISDNPPVIYIDVNVRNIAENKNENKWLTYVIDKIHDAPSKEYGDKEEIIFIKSKSNFMKWIYFNENIKDRFENIGRWNNYKFNCIEGIKVRESFELARLCIYK